ncbi:MAG: dipeptidase [Gemmatimonadota bacterium]
MRHAVILAALAAMLAPVGCASTPAARPDPAREDEHMALARRVLSTTPLFDGHNDLPWAIRGYDEAPHDVVAYDLRGTTPGHTDIARLRAGMVGAQFWSVYIPYSAVEEGAARVQLEQIDIAQRVFERYPDVFQEALTPDAAVAAFESGRIASVMGMEGGHAIENSLGALRAFHRLGARYLTLTHSSNIDWADSCCEPAEHGGLTEFGKEVVREMNRLGMLVDLSHVSPETMHDALDVTEAPVIFSHSSARGVTDHDRNVPDDVLRRLPTTDGVVMITFVPSFITTELPATIGDVIAHIEHVRDVAGMDHVGIGADYDGISSTPEGLEDVSTYPVLFAELARRGWSEGELRQLAGENVLRVWRKAEDTRIRLRARPASTATIEALDGSGR